MNISTPRKVLFKVLYTSHDATSASKISELCLVVSHHMSKFGGIRPSHKITSGFPVFQSVRPAVRNCVGFILMRTVFLPSSRGATAGFRCMNLRYLGLRPSFLIRSTDLGLVSCASNSLLQYFSYVGIDFPFPCPYSTVSPLLLTRARFSCCIMSFS